MFNTQSPSPFFGYKTKILILLTDNADNRNLELNLLSQFVALRKFHNIATINLNAKNFSFLSYNPYSSRNESKIQEIHQPKTFADLFEDKVKNLNGNIVRVYTYPDEYNLFTDKGQVVGPYLYLLDIIRQRLNATLSSEWEYTITDYKSPSYFFKIYSRGIDICLVPSQVSQIGTQLGEQFTYPFTQDLVQIMILRKSASLMSFVRALLPGCLSS